MTGAGSLAPGLPPGHAIRHPVRPALGAAARLPEHQGQEGAVPDAGPDQPPGSGGRGHAAPLSSDVPQPLHAGEHEGGPAAAGEAGGPQTQLHGGPRAEAGGGWPQWSPGDLRRLSGESHTAAGPRLLGRVIREVIILRSRGSSSICHGAGGQTRGHMLSGDTLLQRD